MKIEGLSKPDGERLLNEEGLFKDGDPPLLDPENDLNDRDEDEKVNSLANLLGGPISLLSNDSLSEKPAPKEDKLKQKKTLISLNIEASPPKLQ